MQLSQESLGSYAPDVRGHINTWFPFKNHPHHVLEHCINNIIKHDDTVLEIGCGRFAPLLRRLKGTVKALRGIDLVDFAVDDPDIQLLNEDVTNMEGIANHSIDVAYSQHVMEHISDIDLCYSELFRTLKPGGLYVFVTPNYWISSSSISHMLPDRWRRTIMGRRTDNADDEGSKPLYLSNTRRSISRLAARHGFWVEQFDYLCQTPDQTDVKRSAMLRNNGRHPTKECRRSRPGYNRWIFCVLKKKFLKEIL